MTVDRFPVRVEPIVYEVTNYPEDGVNANDFTIRVERRDIDRWCVKDQFRCYAADGRREPEPSPSNRTNEFKRDFRFPLEEALELAQRIVPTLRVGAGPNRPGMTAEECWAWEQSRSNDL